MPNKPITPQTVPSLATVVSRRRRRKGESATAKKLIARDKNRNLGQRLSDGLNSMLIPKSKITGRRDAFEQGR